MNGIKDLLHGCAFGVANIIPGVSGGTLALVLGFYERLLGFLNRLTPGTVKELLGLMIQWLTHLRDHERSRAFFSRLQQDDWPFMGRLLAGALTALVGLAALMEFLLEHHFPLTYGFFFGLILLSVKVPWVRISSRGIGVWSALMLGALLTVGIAASVNPAEQAQKKSDLYRAQAEAYGAADMLEENGSLAFTGKYTLPEYGMIFFAGLIAISAMVLPGISGSLIMILLGQYFILIRAISSLLSERYLDDVLFLGTCALGMAIGLLVTARLVEAALRKAQDVTMAFLTGLILGSLYALWPFKEMLVLDEVQRDGTVLLGRSIASNLNQVPSSPADGIPVLVTIALGAAAMAGMMRLEKEGDEVPHQEADHSSGSPASSPPQ